jgi:hypothetical protein
MPFASSQEFLQHSSLKTISERPHTPHRSFTALAQTDHPHGTIAQLSQDHRGRVRQRPASPTTSTRRASPPSAPARRDNSPSRPTKPTGPAIHPAHQPGPVNPSPTARIASQIPRRCQLRPGQSRPTRRHGPEDHVREAVPRNAGAATPAGPGKQWVACRIPQNQTCDLGTRTCSPARQIAGSVWPEQPPGARRSAHRTADPARDEWPGPIA